MDKSLVGPALGKIPSGLYIATSHIDGAAVGMLASFIEQAGFDPPTITVAMQPGRMVHKAVEETRLIGINILSEDNGELMKPFAQKSNPEPFADLSLLPNEYQLPQLTNALAFLACKVTGKLPAGDHIVYTAEVLDGILQNESASPMVRIRRDGFGY
ncbi:MAG: flavin reductase family protein [Verrucomicrobiales bacterium]